MDRNTVSADNSGFKRVATREGGVDRNVIEHDKETL